MLLWQSTDVFKYIEMFKGHPTILQAARVHVHQYCKPHIAMKNSYYFTVVVAATSMDYWPGYLSLETTLQSGTHGGEKY